MWAQTRKRRAAFCKLLFECGNLGLVWNEPIGVIYRMQSQAQTLKSRVWTCVGQRADSMKEKTFLKRRQTSIDDASHFHYTHNYFLEVAKRGTHFTSLHNCAYSLYTTSVLHCFDSCISRIIITPFECLQFNLNILMPSLSPYCTRIGEFED